jgi:hypothetical protein
MDIFPEARETVRTLLKDRIQQLKIKERALKITTEKIKTLAEYSYEWIDYKLVQIGLAEDVVKLRSSAKQYNIMLNTQNKNWQKYQLSQSNIEIARQTPMEEILKLHNIRYRRTGRNLVASCIFHKERTPSFTVFGNNNRWHCFGCQLSGDSIKFIQLYRQTSFREAVQILVEFNINHGI